MTELWLFSVFDLRGRVAKSVKRYTILKFALKILHEILHQHFSLKSQEGRLKQKIIARLRKEKVLQAFTPPEIFLQ